MDNSLLDVRDINHKYIVVGGIIIMNYEREASQLLRRLGANSSYVGFYYVTYGVSQNIQKPELITFITKGLYAEIAIKYQTTVGCVERDMRTVINTIWQHGNRELLEIIFERNLTRKPRNGEFIDALSNYIINI